ncbi:MULTISPECIES: carbohydrate ABC transporter permease [Kosmotoga]|jgi:multiple sugar transport system permease protein|uniref:Binding-protein-dependent transport systems inner membrane component n=1 Tax=Kosmotoga olearia (strain ATCC BAA-1733 / DSM 21960 / TBF 19.5.1) TaxID=521045 RepID=C5CFH8_KOSOT|nr:MULTISPECIES: carbohydrate ABC transporter permease [Kosmotoga]ACR79396.1 binding-protein-dependent transport systems inner membrane component [Kosmotoga olearia TBF 19.5.1]OAA22634.1 hypothetical protein DU53_03750 [Kosmotoga sp. DU53]
MFKISTFEKIITYVILCILTIVMAGPFVAMVSVSFQAKPVSSPGDWFGTDLTLKNYIQVLRNSKLSRWFLNSVIITVSVTVCATFLASMGGYVFAKKEFPGKEFLFWAFMAFMMFPIQAWIIPMFIEMSYLGLVNTYWPFILSGASSGFGIFLIRQFIDQNIPNEIIEAAKIDGASEMQIYFRVVLPLIKPALATLAIFLFISWWNQFLFPLIMTTTSDMYTLPVGMSVLRGIFGQNVSWSMAATTLALIPTIVIFVLFQKYITKGIAIDLK